MKTLRDRLASSMTPPRLRAFLEAALADQPPAEGLPALYATTRRAFAGLGVDGVVVILAEGVRVRVTDAGNAGDLGITQELDEPKRYQARAVVNELTDFSDAPAPSRGF